MGAIRIMRVPPDSELSLLLHAPLASGEPVTIDTGEAAGSWRGIDADAFKAYIRERRRTTNRPPVEL